MKKHIVFLLAGIFIGLSGILYGFRADNEPQQPQQATELEVAVLKMSTVSYADIYLSYSNGMKMTVADKESDKTHDQLLAETIAALENKGWELITSSVYTHREEVADELVLIFHREKQPS